MSRIFFLCSSLALAAGISGCHGVRPVDASYENIEDQDICPGDTTNNELCQSINLADGYRRGYLRRAGFISGTRDAFGYSIIAASTLALYYAATPQPIRTNAAGAMVASPDYAQRVRRMGAIGAGLYAYGKWGLPKARDLVYIDGARAMSCAVLKAAPAIPAIQQESTIKCQLSAVVAARDALLGMWKPGATNEVDPVTVQAALDESSNLIDQATQLLVDITSAGPRLRARIYLIDVAVRRRLVDDSPTFESLVALTASLPGISRSLNANLTPATSPEKISSENPRLPGEQQNNSLGQALGALKEAVRTLKTGLIQLAGVRSAVDSVEECSVGGGAQFAITPSATNVTVEVKKTYQVVVTDPVGHPSASIAGGQTAAVELKAIELTGKDHEYRVTVTGKEATTAATKPILSIRSASGISGADISLTVTGTGQ